jgi:hypothetical protein
MNERGLRASGQRPSAHLHMAHDSLRTSLNMLVCGVG